MKWGARERMASTRGQHNSAGGPSVLKTFNLLDE